MNHSPPVIGLRAIIDRLAAVTGYEVDWVAMPPVACSDPAVVHRLCELAAHIAAAELESELYDEAASHFREVMTEATSAEDIDREVRVLAVMLDRRDERRNDATIHRGKLRDVFRYLRDHDAALPAADNGRPSPETIPESHGTN